MAKLFAPAVVSAPAAAAPPQRLLDLSHEHSERTPQFMGEFDAACGLAAVARGGGWGQAARWEVIASLGPLLCSSARYAEEKAALTDEEGEVRELIREDFRGMRPVREAMPELIEAMAEFRHKLGCPRAEAPKVHIGFRLAADVVESVRASGPGYNARVEQALREAGFGTKALKQAKIAAAAKKRRAAKLEAKPAVSKRRA
jgi:uncharacterized protein (DUF4415 family)